MYIYTPYIFKIHSRHPSAKNYSDSKITEEPIYIWKDSNLKNGMSNLPSILCNYP